MLRLTTVCLAFVLLGAAAPIVTPATEGDSSAIDEDGSATEQAASETNKRAPANTEPAEIEPLIPIETKNSIRVNANVSLPQDI